MPTERNTTELDARQRAFLAGRWKIQRAPESPDDPFPWTIYNTAWEHLDLNTDLACIEGGRWATWSEAFFAFTECLKLVQKCEF